MYAMRYKWVRNRAVFSKCTWLGCGLLFLSSMALPGSAQDAKTILPSSFQGPTIPEAVSRVFSELAPKIDEFAGKPEKMEELASKLEKEFEKEKAPEAIRMLIAIAQGSQMGPMDGWFGPAKYAYDFAWLTQKLDQKDASEVKKETFKESPVYRNTRSKPKWKN